MQKLQHFLIKVPSIYYMNKDQAINVYNFNWRQ